LPSEPEPVAAQRAAPILDIPPPPAYHSRPLAILRNPLEEGDDMAIASNLGFPRIGIQRELKRAVEGYWNGTASREELEATARQLRRRHWDLQATAGIAQIPSNDFSLYDHVLDAVAMVGAVPRRFCGPAEAVDLVAYFAMARGAEDAPPMDMTKWFDTNYHYIVPEFEPGMAFRLASTKPIDEFTEAMGLGLRTRPVLVGPVSLLLLGRSRSPDLKPLDLLDSLLGVYEEVIGRLGAAGAAWVQVDEPVLALDLGPEQLAAFPRAYARLAAVARAPKICLATYFGDLGENLEPALRLPVAAIHLDLVRAPGQLDRALAAVPAGMRLSLGVIDGRNVWRADLDRAIDLAERAAARLGKDRLLIGPSCSLLHCPIDLEGETRLDEEIHDWLSFARQKLGEIATVARVVEKGRGTLSRALAAGRAAVASRSHSPRTRNPEVRGRVEGVNAAMLAREKPYAQRRAAQQARLGLPLLPTTTIGSFPQTTEVRKARQALRKGQWTAEQYEAFCREEIERVVRFQEDLGLDVLVHGECERNDMVEYFGEQLAGFAFTENGWVQSYGSRCVKPPIILGDVSRPRPMTVRWSQYAQSLTRRPMKGMLTGPITIMKWSFVRDDQPARETAVQIALAIRDEVADLEAAGLGVIQIDEPALREGLPLRKAEWPEYLRWAVEAFRLASCGARDETQIHTHMCYSQFDEIVESIAALDADVLSIEAARSDMELLEAFSRTEYPNEIGPGMYDIHSPRIPDTEEMIGRLRKALRHLKPERLWVNPDCGLKTRAWPETIASLKNMVAAAESLRRELAK
jgi:5-methyltetrahydropteroyltriglutamate--homocysteine methyltransferase